MIPENDQLDVELISIEIDQLEDGKIDHGKPKSLVSSQQLAGVYFPPVIYQR